MTGSVAEPRELPQGTVTLLFTDIEGSTQMLRRLGRDRYVHALTEHRRLLREAFRRHGGVEVEMQGDSFHYAFAYARNAVAAAADAQRALGDFSWPDEPIRVRIGLHTGEPVVQDGLYAGLDVHRAARVMSVGSGGQVLLSARTADLVENELPPGLELKGLGTYVLKDFERPELLTQVAVDGLVEVFPPVRAPAADDVRGGRRRFTRRRLLLVAAALAVAAGAAVAAIILSRPGTVGGPMSDAVVAIDPARNVVVSRTQVGSAPTRIAVGAGGVWVLNSDDATISKLDPTSGAVIRTGGTTGAPADLVAGGGVLWVLARPASVLRLNSDLVVTGTIHLKSGLSTFLPLSYLSYANGSLWVANRELLSHVDPRTRSVVSTTPFYEVGPVAAGGGHVWVAGQKTLFRFDGDGRRVERRLPFALGEITVFGRWLWAVDQYSDSVDLVDPEHALLFRTIPVGRSPTSVTAGYGSIWVASEDGTVTRIDPDTGNVMARIRVGGAPQDIAVGYGRVWLASP